MTVNWAGVLGQALKAAEHQLGGKWPLVRQSATFQIQALVESAAALEGKKGSLSPDECELVKRIQTRALSGILASYEAIGIVAAEQAAEATWGVVAGALKTATGLTFIV